MPQVTPCPKPDLMVVLRLADWAMFGEKLQLGAAVVFLSVGTVLMAVSHRRKVAK